MSPAISHIIGIDETGFLFTNDSLESDTTLVLYLIIILWVWFPFLHALHWKEAIVLLLPPINASQNPFRGAWCFEGCEREQSLCFSRAYHPVPLHSTFLPAKRDGVF